MRSAASLRGKEVKAHPHSRVVSLGPPRPPSGGRAVTHTLQPTPGQDGAYFLWCIGVAYLDRCLLFGLIRRLHLATAYEFQYTT